MTTTPAETLRAAAETLRDLADRATHDDRPHWTTGHTLGSRTPVVVDHPETPSVLVETYAARLEAVNRYIAVMDPALGAALADWLERTAKLAALYAELHHAETGTTVADPHPDGTIRDALAVARAILEPAS